MRKQENTRPIIIRYVIAFIGAVSITIGLLLFMNDLISRFFERDAIQYFAITDYIPAPDRGRQLPDAPPAPSAAPDAPALELAPEEEIVMDGPVIEPDLTLPATEQAPNLDE
ncbi:MAG: hypothetical protein ACJ0SL_08805 [Candidatus Rariloculaceae bacterium]